MEQLYKGMLGTAILFFAVYLATHIRLLGAIGGIVLLLTALLRFYCDWRNGSLPWKKNKEKRIR